MREKVLAYIQGTGFSEALGVDTVPLTKDYGVYIPSFDVLIFPSVSSLEENRAVLLFKVSHPDWNQVITLGSLGFGADPDEAARQALVVFALTFMQGVKKMQEKAPFCETESSFLGKTHKWSVYCGDVLRLASGDRAPGEAFSTPQEIWDLLGEDIRARLGDKALSVVEIYASVTYGVLRCECRIDGFVIPDLSKKLEDVAISWSGCTFNSRKAVFFIEQAPETHLTTVYDGFDGRQLLKQALTDYMRLFSETQTQEDYDTLEERTADLIGDAPLAKELHLFMFELCARVYYMQFPYSDEILIITGDSANQVYSSQMYDYCLLYDVLLELISESALGEDTPNICTKLMCASQTYTMLQDFDDENGSPENYPLIRVSYRTDAEFTIR